MQNEEWLRTLWVCLLVIAFIVLASVAADKAFALSPLPDTQWEIKEDDAGLPVMINKDNNKGVIFSFGYQNSKNCGDIRMIIGDIVPGNIKNAPTQPLQVPSEMSTPATDSIPLPPIPITFMAVDETKVLMLYTYTPSDKLLFELMNAPIFTWRSPAFKEGHRAQFNNETFVDTLNLMSEQCLKVLPSTQPAPKEEETYERS